MKVNELKAAMDAQFVEMKAQFAQAGEELDPIDHSLAQIAERFDALDMRVTAEEAETRRHITVVAEDLMSDLRLLASAVVANTATLERHINTSLSETKTVSAALDDHEVRLTMLERHRS